VFSEQTWSGRTVRSSWLRLWCPFVGVWRIRRHRMRPLQWHLLLGMPRLLSVKWSSQWRRIGEGLGTRRETVEGDSPTLNLTFLGAEAEDPFVVFSWGTPCVLAAPIVDVADGLCVGNGLCRIERRGCKLEMMWEEINDRSSHQLYTISISRVDLPFYWSPVNPLLIRIIPQRIKVVIKQPDGSVRDI